MIVEREEVSASGKLIQVASGLCRHGKRAGQGNSEQQARCQIVCHLSFPSRTKLKYQRGLWVKLQAAFLAVALAANDNERGHEAEHLELLTELIGRPALLRFREVASEHRCAGRRIPADEP